MPGNMGKRKMVVSLGRTRIKAGGAQLSREQKERQLLNFITGTMLCPVTIDMHVG